MLGQTCTIWTLIVTGLSAAEAITEMNGTRLSRFGSVVIFAFVASISSAGKPAENQDSQEIAADEAAALPQNQVLYEKMLEARNAIWTRFHDPVTSQFFTAEPARLPNAERVKRLDPNDCGYGTGMDDGPLFGGILLVAICDQFEVTHNDALKADALAVAKGLQFCATAHGVPGFVARGVCLEDGKSIYVTSSRDQYTHLVHGLWRYYHSPLCATEDQQAIREILQAVADRMTRNVTPENNYDFLRADGTQDPRGICRMLDVRTHEAARLPMLYAAAWDVGRNDEHYRLYRKYLPHAIAQSLELPNLPQTEIARWIPPYAVLQMQSSLEVLRDLESEPERKSQIQEAMLRVSTFAADKRVFAATHRQPSVRECGETALAQLILGEPPLAPQQQADLAHAIMKAKYPVDPGAAYCLLGAYWKARLRGYLQP